MKIHIAVKKSRAYLPVLVDEVRTKTLTILATHILFLRDDLGQYNGILQITDVYGNLMSFPKHSVLSMHQCYATKLILKEPKGKMVWIRHPAVPKFDGAEWVEKPSKLIFTDKEYFPRKSVFIYYNPEEE